MAHWLLTAYLHVHVALEGAGQGCVISLRHSQVYGVAPTAQHIGLHIDKADKAGLIHVLHLHTYSNPECNAPC
jgi:hypothetical protein